MAGRSGKPSKRQSPHVEESDLFAFKLDGIDLPSVAPAKRRKAVAPAKEKPHYHDHRQRLRQRFEEAGASALADYELLELFLFRTIPRQDTKPLAKALRQKFGSLDAVLAAPSSASRKWPAPARQWRWN